MAALTRASVSVDTSTAQFAPQIPDLLAAVRGFDTVTVDPRGFRSGSLNEALDGSYR